MCNSYLFVLKQNWLGSVAGLNISLNCVTHTNLQVYTYRTLESVFIIRPRAARGQQYTYNYSDSVLFIFKLLHTHSS